MIVDENYIIKQVLSGNKHAYANIINTYKTPLYATVLRMTSNPQLAQDLVQEAFIKIYEQLEHYKEGAFKSWLYRVAINHCIDELRKKQYSIKNETLQDDQLVETNHPEVIYLKKERERQLEDLISELPEMERMILLLRYNNELRYEEIAQLLKIPLSDVRNKLHRAKKKMREQVRKRGDFDELSERG